MTPAEKIAIMLTPGGYAEFRLGIKLHPKQKEVLNSLFIKRKTKISFRAANECGKTGIVITAAILFALEIGDAMVISTSATFRQITKQLIPYLKKYSNLYPNWEFLDNMIKINGEPRFIGFSTSEDAKFQGYHEQPNRPLLIIIDEAAGVKDQIFQSVGRCNPTWLLITGSPLGPEGVFYSIETDPNMYNQFKHFKITKYDCLSEDGWWLNKQDIDNFISMWSPENPLVKSSVFAEFATNIENGIITLSEIDKNIRNSVVPDYSNGKHVALDFAAGGDSNVIALRNGNQIKIIKVWKEKDTMLAARQFVDELYNLKTSYGIQPSEVSGDADGLGKPIIDRIKELGWPINEFHGGSVPKDTTSYKNKISECWIDACKKIRGGIIGIPNDQELILQLTSRKQYMHTSGKLILESKEDMRGRGIPSPDIADAVCMCISEPNSGLLNYIHIPKYKTPSYNRFF